VTRFGHSVLDRLGLGASQTEAIVSSLRLNDYPALRVPVAVEPDIAMQGSR
jgi:hypothetical protein